MVKQKTPPPPKQTKPYLKFILNIFLGGLVALPIVIIGSIYYFEKTYQGKIYPGVAIDGINFGGKTPLEVEKYFAQKSLPFENLKITLTY